MDLYKSKWAIILWIIAFLSSIFLVITIMSGEPLTIDKVVASRIEGLFQKESYPFFEFISEFGDKIGIGIVSLLFLLWLWWKKRDYAGMATLVFAVALGNEANKLLKELIARPRPGFEHIVNEESLSFPSGHAMVGMILYFIVSYFLIRASSSVRLKLGIFIITLLLLLLIGFSRLVLQDHYATDVVGGYLIGFLWAFLWTALYELFNKRLNKSK